MSNAPKNDRLLRVLRRESVDRTPVWLMRQAGRYLPEYRATRQRAGSFLAMAKNPDIACEVTLQPLARFPLDAAILFSDILTIPDAMGLELYFVDGEGPKFRHPVRDAASIAKLAVPDMETELRYVMDAVRLIRRELDDSVPLIGFSGSPWTLACYMVEGGGSKDFARIKAMALNDPAALHQLLSVNTDAVIAYLGAQRAAGAQVLQVFDTWGGVLSPEMYREFSLPYLTRIARELERGDDAQRTPLILFGKGNAPYLEELADSRRRRHRRRLAGRAVRSRAPHAGQGRAAGQPRPGDPVRIARGDPPPCPAHARQLRHRQRRVARRTRLQPRPWHVAGHGSRARGRTGECGARVQRALNDSAVQSASRYRRWHTSQ